MSFVMKLTAIGAAKIAAASAGDPVALTEMAAGDGDGAPVDAPDGSETALVNEVWRDTLTSLSVSLVDPEVMIAEAVIGIAEGPFAVREIGIFDAEGDLFAYGNFPETYKPDPVEGSAREMLIRVSIRVTTAENVTILIDESAVFATQSWCNGRFLQIEANLADVEDPAEALTNLGGAPLESPIFTGDPRAPTPDAADDDTSIPNTAWTKARIAAAVAARAPQQIGSTISTTSGTTITINNLLATDFNHIYVELLGVSVSALAWLQANFSDNGSSWSANTPLIQTGAADTLYGSIFLPNFRRDAGQFSFAIRPLAANRSADGSAGGVGAWRLTNGVNHFRIGRDTGNFDAGQVRAWGIY